MTELQKRLSEVEKELLQKFTELDKELKIFEDLQEKLINSTKTNKKFLKKLQKNENECVEIDFKIDELLIEKQYLSLKIADIEPKSSTDLDTPDITKMKVGQLKDLCRDFKIRGYSSAKKDELIEMILKNKKGHIYFISAVSTKELENRFYLNTWNKIINKLKEIIKKKSKFDASKIASLGYSWNCGRK